MPVWQNALFAIAILGLLAVALLSANRYFGWTQPQLPVGELAGLHQTLLADSKSVRGNWLRTMNPLIQDVQGDLVWNSASQQGVMRLVNLPAAPKGNFYQLWMYDTRNLQGKPVSAAIFREGAVGQHNELFIPLKPASQVIDPFKFELRLHSETNDSSQILLMVQS
jgi:hypothetical protein